VTGFTCTPNPANVGEQVTICYETQGAQFPMTLRIQWFPDLPGLTFEVAASDLPPGVTKICFDVEVPAGAEGGLVVDQSKQSNDLPITVVP
jgi:hypothetical protein